jgi:hypothetical protein
VSCVTSVPPHDIAHCLALGERSLLERGDLGASRSWFDAGYEAAEAAGQAGGMAQAALGLGGLWVHEHRTAAATAAVKGRRGSARSMRWNMAQRWRRVIDGARLKTRRDRLWRWPRTGRDLSAG